MEVFLVLLFLAIVVVLFASEKLPVDLVAMVVLISLLLLGWVTPREGISGFSNPATITVAAMFVLSSGLQKTGALAVFGQTLMRTSHKPTLLLLLIMITVGGISAFINNTATVAVFLPLIMAITMRRDLSPAQLLIPLSFASQFGGVCTLIGTSTNLLVSSISERHGYGAFTMFEFSQLGLIMLAVGVVYLLTIGRWLLPKHKGKALTEAYRLGKYITELRTTANSPCLGKSIEENEFGKRHEARVLEVLRHERKLPPQEAGPLREGDVLLVRGKVEHLMELKTAQKLELEPEFQLADESLQSRELALVEAIVPIGSRLIGRTLVEWDFHQRYRALVLAIRRRKQTIRIKLRNVRLEFGDALLLQAPKAEMERLRHDGDLLLLEEVSEPALRRDKVPLAIGIILGVVALAATGVLDIVVAALVGAAAMVLTRCLRMDEVHASIDWRVIFLLAGLIPLGIAMEKSGAAQFLAQKSLQLFGDYGPVMMLAVIYLLTALLTECLSNNAAAILMAPIAISFATAMDVAPKPFLMAVCFAASTSFATPVGYQTNTMVYHPGGYRFGDFARVGIPLNLLFWGLAVFFIPRFWPFALE